jgi:hypothetical protein
MILDRQRIIGRLARRRAAGVFTVAVLLGAAVGSTSAALALMELFVRRPLGGIDATRIVQVTGLVFHTPDEPALSWWRRAPSLEQLGTYMSGTAEVVSADGWQTARVSVVSASFFEVFGARPIKGRHFTPSEEDATPVGAAIVSHRFSERRSVQDSSIVGQLVQVGERQYVVTGVAPEGFDYPAGTEVWLAGRVGGPLSRSLRRHVHLPLAGPSAAWVGRLRPERTARGLESELLTLLTTLKRKYPEGQVGESVEVRSLRESLSQYPGPPLKAFTLGSVLLLLVASISGGTLLGAYLTSRLRDIATICSLGATPADLYRNAALVLVVLWGLTSTIGWCVTLALLRGAESFSPLFATHVPPSGVVRTLVIPLCLALSLVSVLIVAAAATARLPGGPIAQQLRSGPWATPTSSHRWQHLLGLTQVSLSILLLTNAIATSTAFQKLSTQRRGFDPNGVVLLQVRFPAGRADEYLSGVRAALAGVRTIPQVRSVGFINNLPFAQSHDGLWIGRGPAWSDRVFCDRYWVAGDLFTAFRTALVKGRAPHEGELGVAVVSESAETRLLDSSMTTLDWVNLADEDRSVQLVGIAETIPSVGSRDSFRCQLYIPYGDTTQHTTRARLDHLAIRCLGRCSATVMNRATREIIAAGGAVGRIQLLSDAVQDELRPITLRATLSLCYALLGMALTILGSYALTALAAHQRAYEMGIRLAVGATPRQVALRLMSTIMRSTLVGTIAGMALATIVSRLGGSYVTAVALQPSAIVLSGALILGSSALAAGVPALKLAYHHPTDLIGRRGA